MPHYFFVRSLYNAHVFYDAIFVLNLIHDYNCILSVKTVAGMTFLPLFGLRLLQLSMDCQFNEKQRCQQIQLHACALVHFSASGPIDTRNRIHSPVSMVSLELVFLITTYGHDRIKSHTYLRLFLRS
jgi:hypothetical protein